MLRLRECLCIKRKKKLIHLSLTYFAFRTGIGPEVFAFVSSDGNYTGGSPATEAQIEFYNKHGFYITAPDYILRPEVLESNFYAWRVTGESKYLERAEKAIKSFETYCKVKDKGYAGLVNVDDSSSSRQMIDDTQSFWFSEVLKYLYVDFYFFSGASSLIYLLLSC